MQELLRKLNINEQFTKPIRGIKFGNKEQINILKDLNKYSIQMAINKKAQKILSFSPLMINLLPSRNVILVPVKETW